MKKYDLVYDLTPQRIEEKDLFAITLWSIWQFIAVIGTSNITFKVNTPDCVIFNLLDIFKEEEVEGTLICDENGKKKVVLTDCRFKKVEKEGFDFREYQVYSHKILPKEEKCFVFTDEA